MWDSYETCDGIRIKNIRAAAAWSTLLPGSTQTRHEVELGSFLIQCEAPSCLVPSQLSPHSPTCPSEPRADNKFKIIFFTRSTRCKLGRCFPAPLDLAWSILGILLSLSSMHPLKLNARAALSEPRTHRSTLVRFKYTHQILCMEYWYTPNMRSICIHIYEKVSTREDQQRS